MKQQDGGLFFEATLSNEQLIAAVEETIKRIQGLSDATVAGSRQMDDSFYKTSEEVRKALGMMGQACEIHESEITKLEEKYHNLAEALRLAESEKGNTASIDKIKSEIQAVEGEISVRKKLLKEVQEASNELERLAQKKETERRETEKNTQAYKTLRTQIREVEIQMATMIAQGEKNGLSEYAIKSSEAYKALAKELGRLNDIQGDIKQQGKILANDEARFQGLIQGISGLSGAFSAATGATSLFAGENENLQKVMTKVQSVMAITLGLQQVAQTLNKDSAFQLVTLNGLKEWWAGIVAKATIAETAEAGATQLNTAAKEQNAVATGKATATEVLDTAAKGANTVAATAGTVANLTLAGAFRAVGLAIKSIPIFGWIITGISALIAVVAHFNNKAKDAKEAQAKLVEQHYKTIGSINELSEKWKRLGSNMEGKKKLIKESQKAFEDYGVVVRDIADAENLLIKNKTDFINAQIAKAQSLALLQSDQYQNAMKKGLEARLALQDATKEWNETVGKRTGRKASTMEDFKYSVKDGKVTKYTAANASLDMLTAMKEAKEAEFEMQKIYGLSEELREKHDKTIDSLNRDAIEKNKHTVAGRKALLEQELEDLKTQRGQLVATDTKAIAEYDKRIKAKQAEIDKLESKTTTSKSNKDPFIEQLEKRKQAYIEMQKLLESNDEKARNEGERRWAELKKQGSSYIEYLKGERNKLEELGSLSSKQQLQLLELYKRIAEEEKGGVLSLFGEELRRDVDAATSVVDKLSVLATARESNDGNTGADKAKQNLIEEEEKRILATTLDNYNKVKSEHRSLTDSKLSDYEKYSKEVSRLEKAIAQETSEAHKKILLIALSTAKTQQADAKANEYAALVEQFQTYEERRLALAEEYAKKRELAGDNATLQAEIDKREQRDLSALAVEELQNSSAWSNLFANLDSLTSQQIDTLITEIEKKFSSLSGVFDPIDLEAIRKKLNEARTEIIDRNPFAQLGEALEAVLERGEGDNKKSVGQIQLDWKNLSQAVSGSFDFVHDAVESCTPLKEIIGEVGATAIDSLGAISSSAIAVATAVRTAEQSTVILAIIQAALVAVRAILNILKLHDKFREKAIQGHTKNIKRLEKAYNKLERAIERTFGTEKYDNAKRALENLNKTAEEARKKAAEERRKNKPKEDKIEEYEREAEQIEQKREDLLNKLRDEVIGGSARSIAEELGNAFVEAFARGEDALDAWGKSVDKMIQNIAKKMIVEAIIGKQVEAIIKQYQEKWKDESGNVNPQKIVDEAASFGQSLRDVGKKNKEAIEALLKSVGIGQDMGSETTIKGVSKNVSEKTAGLIEGQMNAIRINQAKSMELIRAQLQHLYEIERNTRYLASIDRRLSNMQGKNFNERAYGA